jgi:HlyD family secretion protein
LDSINKVKKVKVTTGIQDINYIEIKTGISEGQEVITGPYEVVSKTLNDSLSIKKVDKKDLFDKK